MNLHSEVRAHYHRLSLGRTATGWLPTNTAISRSPTWGRLHCELLSSFSFFTELPLTLRSLWRFVTVVGTSLGECYTGGGFPRVETLLLGVIKHPFVAVKAVWSHASWFHQPLTAVTALSREKGREGELRIQHLPPLPPKNNSKAGDEVECMKNGRSTWCKCFMIPEVILRNGHSIIEKTGRWLEPVGRSAESSGKCEPRCVGWERAEWWIGKGTYSSRHEGLCLGLHVFDDCNTIRQSNQLKYAHQHALFGVTTRMLTRSPEF